MCLCLVNHVNVIYMLLVVLFLSFCVHAVKMSMCDVFLLQYRMVDPAHGALDESYTPEDDSQEVHSVFSEEGTTRRPDNGVRRCENRFH